MTIRRTLIKLLDRPLGRMLLAKTATAFARKQTKQDVAVLYDDVWLRRIGNTYFADSLSFRYAANSFLKLSSRYETTLASCHDHWFHLYTPQLGDIIVDIGAGDGSEPLVFSRLVGNTGKVLAVEAHPTTFRLLATSCKRNRLKNVAVSNTAIVDTNRSVFIENRPKHISNSVKLEFEANCIGRPITGMSLDDVCEKNGISHIDYLKMNIEGAERLAIRGMTTVIRKTRFITIACHDFKTEEGEEFQTKHAVIDFLTANHFEIIQREDDDRGYVRNHIHGRNTCFDEALVAQSGDECHACE